jgi:hypothetical protein
MQLTITRVLLYMLIVTKVVYCCRRPEQIYYLQMTVCKSRPGFYLIAVVRGRIYLTRLEVL